MQNDINALLEVFRERDETINVHTFNNGYMVEISGRDFADDYVQRKVICLELQNVFDVITRVNEIQVR